MFRKERGVFKKEQRRRVEPSTLEAMGILSVAGVLAVVGGLAFVAFMTWKNGEPTPSIAEVLYDVEHPVGSEAPRPVRGPRR